MEVPGELVDAWSKVTDASDSLAALRNMPTLRDALGQWEASLARDALANGASWATIGEALGTSRQAAWERLRPGIAAAIEADRRRLAKQRARAARRRGEKR
ncbi:MAG TPA: hypothetical protein VFV00_19165 [Acidimicrobiales bacterium]|nr:hypothetical protein [Acidimicrobiales bacterium]